MTVPKFDIQDFKILHQEPVKIVTSEVRTMPCYNNNRK